VTTAVNGDSAERRKLARQTKVADTDRFAAARAVAVLAVALAPTLAAIWCVPWFVTQDGPAHVYNAEILASAVGGFHANSTWREVYTVRWQPIPNWAGPLSLAVLVSCLPAWLADRVMTTVTLVGFAGVLLWLRWRVAGTRGLTTTALLAAILASSIPWLLGFTSFMLGACLFPVTLGVWWHGRDDLRWPRIAALGGLLALGYFCHLVSLALTVAGISFLAIVAPIRSPRLSFHWRARVARLMRTSVSFLPALLLGLRYLQIATERGPMRPIWEGLTDPFSPRFWLARLAWADPISLAIRDGLPFTDREGTPFLLLAPVVWLAIGLALWSCGRIVTRLPCPELIDRKSWFALAAAFIIGGVAGPDSLGEAHGGYLPQRVVLLGLAALVPVFDVDLTRLRGRCVIVALAIAILCQSAVVWDYALYSNRTAGALIGARDSVGTGQRVAAILASSRGRFRANPLLHAANWLGVGTGNVIWNNYETLHYYFPVQFSPGIDRPSPAELESISLREAPNSSVDRGRDWERLLKAHSGSIDVLIEWKSDPTLDTITARWFERAERTGNVSIWRRR
jgi:hypothetical protein